MSTKGYRPTSPRKANDGHNYSDLTKRPEKSLLSAKKKNSGRNHYGRIVRSSRWRNRQKYPPLIEAQ